MDLDFEAWKECKRFSDFINKISNVFVVLLNNPDNFNTKSRINKVLVLFEKILKKYPYEFNDQILSSCKGLRKVDIIDASEDEKTMIYEKLDNIIERLEQPKR